MAEDISGNDSRQETFSDDGALVVDSISKLVDAVSRILTADQKADELKGDQTKYEYYFRGETENFNKNESEEGSSTALDSYLDREDKNWRHLERNFYHDAYRLNPESFVTDRTMVERLTRMQHYRLPTRFADLSSNALLATYFACEDALDKATCLLKDGNLRIFKIHPLKMKHFSSDIITAIAHLPLVTDEQFDIGDESNLGKSYSGLSYLSYEINKERPSFSLEEDLAERLRRDIQQVWAFKPIWNNDRIRYQEGIFLAFGCGNHKASLDATFSAGDFRESELFNKDFSGKPSPTNGIMQIGRVAIKERAKNDILIDLRKYYGIMKELVYPDLADACKTIADEASNKAKTADKTKNELERIVKSLGELTGQKASVQGSPEKGYCLKLEDRASTSIQPGKEVKENPTDAEVYKSFWSGFREHVQKKYPNAPDSFFVIPGDDDKEIDRRNWFNTHITGRIDQNWFDLNYTYTKKKTISIYICTQNLATRNALSCHKDGLNTVMKRVMGDAMEPEWEKQNFPNRPNGMKRIVFSLDCSRKSDEVVYAKMVEWMAVLAKYLSENVAMLYFKKKVFNSSDFAV